MTTRLTLDLDGPTHLLEFGGNASGVPWFLVHGLDGSAANFLDLGPLLTERGPTLAIDLPGFGRSPLAGRSPRMTASADVVAAAVRATCGGPVHLVGNSMGAVVVLLVAQRHPELVDSVTLVAPAVPRAGTGPVAWSFAPVLVPFWLGLGSAESRRRMRQDPRRRVRQLLDLCLAPGSSVSPATFDEMVEVADERDPADAVPAWTGAARDLFGRLVRRGAFHRTAARVTAPVHVIEGAADPIIPASSIEDAVRRHGWRHSRLDGVGHAPMLEDPCRTATAMLDTVVTA